MKRFRTVDEKLRVLELAAEEDNVAALCRRLGVSRSTFYEMKKAYERQGADGLAIKPRQKPKMPNALSEDAVRQALEMTAKFPSFSCLRISAKLKEMGVAISASSVRKLWGRHGLTKKGQRLAQFRHTGV